MIQFKNVSVRFNGQNILDNVQFSIQRGEFVSLIGESGVGKTTLLRLIYFDLYPSDGEVVVGSFRSSDHKRSDVSKLRRTLGVVFQDYKLLEERNIYDNVAFALEVINTPRSEIGVKTLRALADVGLSHKRNNMPHELSGGEQQRVVIARALINEPSVLLADEPTGNLDYATSLEILQLLKMINSRGTAVILATHNIELVKKSGGKVFELKGGKLADVVV